MPDIFAKHAQGVKSVQNWLGSACQSFAYAGNNYLICPDTAVRSKDLQAGGFKPNADLTFVVVVADLPAGWPTVGPKLREEIDYLGDRYRIREIHKLPGNTLAEFRCDELNQSA